MVPNVPLRDKLPLSSTAAGWECVASATLPRGLPVGELLELGLYVWSQGTLGPLGYFLAECYPSGAACDVVTWIQRSLRFSACGQMVSLQPAFLANSSTASTKHVLFLTL